MEEQLPLPSNTPEPSPASHLPKPTVWPATLALSITFIFWGLISSLIVTGAGLVVFAVALTGWIGNIRHEHQR